MTTSNLEAGTAEPTPRRPDRAETLRDFVVFLAGCEQRFGPSQALLRFGRGMDISCDMPDWMPKGNLGECHAAAVLALVAAQARGRTDLRYTEGYAIERTGMPLAIQHAWLSDGEGRVFDPTWPDHREHLYFGIPFETSFVLDTLDEAELQPGLLVNPALMRKLLADPGRLSAAVATATADVPGVATVFEQGAVAAAIRSRSASNGMPPTA